MGKAELYLNIRNSRSIPGLTQKMRCNCRFSRKSTQESAQGLCRFKKDPDREVYAVFEHMR